MNQLFAFKAGVVPSADVIKLAIKGTTLIVSSGFFYAGCRILRTTYKDVALNFGAFKYATLEIGKKLKAGDYDKKPGEYDMNDPSKDSEIDVQDIANDFKFFYALAMDKELKKLKDKGMW